MRIDKDGLCRYEEHEYCEGTGSSCEALCGWDEKTREWICHKTKAK